MGASTRAFVAGFKKKRKNNIEFSYRFTGLESKKFSWNFAFAVQELLNIESISKSTKVKLHALAFIALQLRDAVSIYTRVEVERDLVTKLFLKCKNYFNACNMFLGPGVSPTNWTVGYAIPYHCLQLFDKLGYGLGLNSMQGREAKHIKLAKYIENTCNVRKNDRWWIVFKHEFISLVWLRELDPLSITYKNQEAVSFIPKKVSTKPTQYCYCGNTKSFESAEKCSICSDPLMALINKSASECKVDSALK